MRLLFNETPDHDVTNILAFIDGFAADFGIDVMLIDVPKIRTIAQGIRRDFPHKDGIDEASVFKKLANFVTYFVSDKPILEAFKYTNGVLPDDLLEVTNHENATIALLIAFAALHGAEIHRKLENGEDGELNVIKILNPIELSGHSFIDLVDAIAVASPSTHFKILTVLLEQLTYKSNPNCQYPTAPFIFE
ncbi:MAG: hypothetical protein GXP22_03550 [Gammaproteobacteria bacterium]|nr:hypothetical protein [Gammaproteobacteria bacterium]